MSKYTEGTHIGAVLGKKRFTLQPRFTVIHHPIRARFGLSPSSYCVIDSIDQLSHRPDHPWCIASKDQIAGFLAISRRSVFNAIDAGLEKGLLEKNDRGDLRTTVQWVEQVRLYEAQERKPARRDG